MGVLLHCLLARLHSWACFLLPTSSLAVVYYILLYCAPVEEMKSRGIVRSVLSEMSNNTPYIVVAITNDIMIESHTGYMM